MKNGLNIHKNLVKFAVNPNICRVMREKCSIYLPEESGGNRREGRSIPRGVPREGRGKPRQQTDCPDH